MNSKTTIVKIALAASLLPIIGACSSEAPETEDAATTAEAGANEVDVKTHMQLTAAEYLEGAMEDTFTPEQVGVLQNVSHQKVVAETCDGFEVDNAKWAKALTPVIEAKKGEADFDAARLHDQLLTGLGLAVGSELSIAAYDQQAFCDGAREERSDTEGSNPYDIYASTDAPAVDEEAAAAPSQ